MLKKIFLKILKFFLIIFVTIKEYISSVLRKKDIEDNDDTGSSKARPITFVAADDDEDIYYNVIKIDKEIKTLLNDLKSSKEEKQEKVFRIYSRLEELDIVNENIIPKNKISEVKQEKIKSIINQDKRVIKEYSHNNKMLVESPKKELEEKKDKKGTKKKVISIEPVVNLENKDKVKLIDYIENTNELLKETKQVFKDIEEDIRCNRRYDENSFKIKDIKEKIKEIKDKYYEFKHNRYIYEFENDTNWREYDEFEIIISDKEIDNYLKKCNLMLEKLAEYKKHSEVVAKKEETKEIKKEQRQKELEKKEEEKEEKKPRLLIELEEAANIITKDVERQNSMISKLEKAILTTPAHERKRVRLNVFDNVLTGALKIGMSLLPFKFIRNRKLGLLVSGFMLNNSIRSMRKILSKDVMCDYVYLSRHIKTELEIASSYERICNDSLYQISSLKDEFIKHYGYITDPEISKVYIKLENLEANITNELERINDSKIKLDKVKKLGKMYDKR